MGSSHVARVDIWNFCDGTVGEEEDTLNVWGSGTNDSDTRPSKSRDIRDLGVEVAIGVGRDWRHSAELGVEERFPDGDH